MLSDSIQDPGYSAFVTALLRVGGTEMPLASIGPNYCILREPQDLPVNCSAELILKVDGQTYIWDVKMPDGAVPFDSRVRLVIGTDSRRQDPTQSQMESSEPASLQVPRVRPPDGRLF